jgi:hypothetical protein
VKRFREALLTLVAGILLQASVFASASYDAGTSGYGSEGSSPQPAPFDPFASYGYAPPAAQPLLGGGSPERPALTIAAAFPIAALPAGRALLILRHSVDYASPRPLYLRTRRLRL